MNNNLCEGINLLMSCQKKLKLSSINVEVILGVPFTHLKVSL